MLLEGILFGRLHVVRIQVDVLVVVLTHKVQGFLRFASDDALE